MSLMDLVAAYALMGIRHRRGEVLSQYRIPGP